MDDTKPSPDPKDYNEGPQAAEDFQTAVKKVLTVPYGEMRKRDEEWKKKRGKQQKRTRA